MTDRIVQQIVQHPPDEGRVKAGVTLDFAHRQGQALRDGNFLMAGRLFGQEAGQANADRMRIYPLRHRE